MLFVPVCSDSLAVRACQVSSSSNNEGHTWFAFGRVGTNLLIRSEVSHEVQTRDNGAATPSRYPMLATPMRELEEDTLRIPIGKEELVTSTFVIFV
jgi:hypothetical protein